MLEEQEDGCVGMGIGSGMDNTNKLKVLGYEEAMETADKANWEASVDCEHECMLKNNVWEVVDGNNQPHGVDIINSTCVMKNMVNGEYHVRVAARGFKQTHCKSFIHHNISSPVVHEIPVRTVSVLMLMGNMEAHLVDV